MKAVIQYKGHQFLVEQGDRLLVDRCSEKKGEEIVFDVLLFFDNEKIKIGQPLLKNVSVIGKVLRHFKGKKIRVARFKAKSRYRRVKGFRPSKTEIEVKKILLKEKRHG